MVKCWIWLAAATNAIMGREREVCAVGLPRGFDLRCARCARRKADRQFIPVHSACKSQSIRKYNMPVQHHNTCILPVQHHRTGQMYSIGLLNSSTQRRSHVMRSHEIFGAKNSFQKHGKRCPYSVDALLDTYYSVNNRRCSFQPAYRL